ncbi:MAG: ferredoxin--NADP reductase [Streptosporangiales bacterium]|nr:ferredoxin--NADP reductase [Streptosporangiales bacterium]
MSEPRARRLRVAEVVRETGDACSLVFDIPDDLSSEFAYRPGQFLTVRVPADDGAVARCYSLSSSPETGDRPAITVKRAGYGSAWLVDHVAAGDELDVLPPAGTFIPASLDADLLLFAGGSGITPVMSIVKSALARGRGQVTVIYANRDENSVIFARQLRELTADNPRLLVIHWLDSVQGYPSPGALAALARPFKDYETFLCGPGPMMEAAADALSGLGVQRRRVRTERFASLTEDPFAERPRDDAGAAGPAATLEVTMDGEKRVLPWPAGARMLDVLIDAGLDAPFSCREGICGACACQVTDGEVKMANNDVLTGEDVADGFILACQSDPLTGTVSITY